MAVPGVEPGADSTVPNSEGNICHIEHLGWPCT